MANCYSIQYNNSPCQLNSSRLSLAIMRSLTQMPYYTLQVLLSRATRTFLSEQTMKILYFCNLVTMRRLLQKGYGCHSELARLSYQWSVPCYACRETPCIACFPCIIRLWHDIILGWCREENKKWRSHPELTSTLCELGLWWYQSREHYCHWFFRCFTLLIDVSIHNC